MKYRERASPSVRAAALPAVVILLAGCLAQPEPNSGIEGTAMLGPTCPVERDPPDPECADRPYEGELVVTPPDQGKVLKRFSTNAHGEFRVALGPGEYSIRNDPGSDNFPFCMAQGAIVVEVGRFTKADVSCDSGIR